MGTLKKLPVLSDGALETALMGLSKAALADLVASLLRRCEGDLDNDALVAALALEWAPLARIRGDRPVLKT